MLRTHAARTNLAALRIRDPNTLTLQEAYEIYRADLARELKAADRAFRGEARPSERLALLASLCDGALLAAGLDAIACAVPLHGEGDGLTADGRALTLLLAALVAAGAWIVRRRLRASLDA